MAFDYSSVKNKKRKDEKPSGFDYSSIKGKTERTDEEKREYVKQRNAQNKTTPEVIYNNKNAQTVDFSDNAKRKQEILGYDDFKKYSIAGLQQSVIDKSDTDNKGYKVYKAANQGRDDSYLRKMMDKDEEDIYNYYLGKFGKEEAEKYFESIAEEMGHRYAELITEKNKDNVLNQLIYGAAAGLENFKEGTKRGLKMLAGNDEVQPTTAYEYGSQMTRENLSDTGPDLGGVSLGQVGYDLVTNTANMLPSMAIGLVTAGLGGSAAMGLSAAGNTYQQDLKDGYTEEEAWKHGALVGAAEGALQYIFGGIGALGGKFTTKAIGKFMPKLKSALARVAVKVPASMASEGFEEYSQEILDTVFRNWIFDENNDIDLLSEEAIYSGILGALTAGFIEGPSVAVNESIKADYDQRFESVKAGIKEENAKAETQYTDDEISEMAQNIMKVMGGTATEENIMEFAGSRDEKAVAERIMSTGRATSDFTIRKDAENYLIEQGVGLKERLTTSGKKQIEKANTMLAENRKAENRDTVLKNGYTEEQIQTMSTEEVAQAAAEIKKAEKMSTDMQVLTEAVKDQSEGYKQTLTKAYEDYAQGNEALKMDAEDFVNEFSSFYDIGRAGVESVDRALEAYGKGNPQLTNALARAYELGKGENRAENIAQAEIKQQAAKKGVKGKIVFEGNVKNRIRNKQQAEAINFMANVLKDTTNMEYHIFASYEKNGKRYYKDSNGNEIKAPNGFYDPDTHQIWIDVNAGSRGQGIMLYTLTHEHVHDIRVWSPEHYNNLFDIAVQTFEAKGMDFEKAAQDKYKSYIKNHPNYTIDAAREEVVADMMSGLLSNEKGLAEFSKQIQQKDASLWNRIKAWFKDVIARITKAYEDTLPESYEARMLMENKELFEKAQKVFAEAVVTAGKNYKNAGVEIDAATESVAPSVMFSERTWSESEYVKARNETARAIASELDVSLDKAYDYIDSINSVAKAIADDRARLDYDPNLDEHATVLKPNSEYGVTVDMSTLCAKRLLTTGTFDAIQKKLPNMVFDSEDIVKLRKMMMDRGYEVACGICYVESTRREMGRITQEFIDRYKIAQQTGKPIARVNASGQEVVLKSQGKTFMAEKEYTPNLGELNTTDIDFVKRDHPEVYNAYLAFMNARGQAKPKLLETRAEYKGEILKQFKNKNAVEKKNLEGGLRLQSFSDFELPHLIDMMQIVMDMSRVGLKSQAYTKVPKFAEAFGDTGIKINLSLIAKGSGVDENGNLVFDDVEGINHEEAFRIRDKFSRNVGTILVGKSDEHIRAAMADPRIDMIIPFHKSSWKESLYEALGLTGYTDYTKYQMEKPVNKSRGKIEQFHSDEYWDYSKTGDENAQIYLQKCREDGRTPVFPQFQNEPGYWKMLIDFKMYDNDGVGAPHEEVKPIFDEDYNAKILNEYKGGHRNLPVAQDVVDDFVKEYSSEVKFQDRDSDGRELSKEQVEFFKESQARDKKGRLLTLYHGTRGKFTEFNPAHSDDKISFFFTSNREVAHSYSPWDTTLDPYSFVDENSSLEELAKVIETNRRYVSVKAVDTKEAEKAIAEFKEKGNSIIKAMEHLLEVTKGTRMANSFYMHSIRDNYSAFKKWIEEGIAPSYGNPLYTAGSKTNEILGVLKEGWDNPGEKVLNAMQELLDVAEPMQDKYDLAAAYNKEGTLEITDRFGKKSYFDKRQALKQANMIQSGGILPVYVNLVKPLVIDAGGKNWNRIPVPPEMKETTDRTELRTRDISEFAHSHGYDGVIFKNLVDMSQVSNVRARKSTVVVAFDSAQIKSVDNKTPTTDPDIRYSERDYSVEENKAVMTKARINYLIEDSGAGSRKDYAQAWITSINPTDYLNLTTDEKSQNREVFDKFGSEWDPNVNMGNYDYLGQLGKSVRQTPYLAIDIDTGKVVGHDGRHRIRALEKEGIKSVEIMVEFREYGRIVKYEPDGERWETLSGVRLTNQFGTGQKALIKNVIPLNEDHRSEIEASYGEMSTKGTNIKYSDRYWEPTLDKDEWRIINYVVDNHQGVELTERTDYFYRNYKGKKLFGIYSTDNGTLLYAVHEDNADDAYKFTTEFAKEYEYGETSVTRPEGLNTWAETVRMRQDDGNGDSGSIEQRKISKDDAEIHGRKFELYAEAALRNVLENIFNESSGDAGVKLQDRLSAADQNRVVILEDQIKRLKADIKEIERHYEKAQDYARAEGILIGQVEQGKEMAKTIASRDAELHRKKESYERKAKNYENMLEAKRAKIAEIRQRRDEILAEQKAAFKEYREQRNEAIRSGGTRKSIEKNAKILMDWLLKNSDKEHVPEALKTTVGDFLETIDFTSKRGLAGGEPTKKDQAFAQKLNNLAAMLEKQRNYMNNANEGDAENPLDCFLDLPEGFAEEIRKLADDVAKTAIGGNFVINDMNSAQLAQLNKALRVLKTSISKMNKLITNAHFASVTEAARSSMLEMAEYKAHKPMNDISEQADKMLKWEMFTPVYAFKRYGSAGESIFKGIQKGWSDFAFAIDKVLKFTEGTYTDKEVEAWEKETHSIKLSDGKTVTLTTAQLMSLYCLNKREQARGHIYGGGIRIADIKKGKAKIQQTEPYLVSFEDVETLISELSDRQIAVADKLQKFMTEQGSEWGNKVSMERFGYRAFTEENYFPIESDANNLIAIDPEAKANDMFRLLNMSATKSLTKGANNAIVISDIFDIFSNHMSDMAKYGSLALPILDTMKWYNYKVRYDVGDGQFRTETVQKSVERAYGKAGKSYFTNFMKDLNGVKEGGRGIGLVNKMVSNYKIASVGANLRVAVLQPTSIVRASMEIEPKYLLQALTKAPAAKKAERKSGIALWKSLGFYNTDIARGIRDQIKGGGKTIDKVRDKTMILAEKMDRITFGTLWNAAEAKAKDLGYSGEELDVKTTEIFDNIIYKTQVVDSTLTRSSLMRSTNEAVKSITAFMAEPTLSYNMVAETVYDMAKERDFSTGWQKNSERFGKAVAIYAASSIAAAVIESIPDAFRDDDDDEWFGQKWWQAFWGEKFWDGNLLSEINVLEKIPLIKDFISVRRGYNIQRLDAAWMSSLNKAIEINTELFNVYVKGEKPTKTTYWGNMTTYGAAYANLRAISQIAGLPVSNTVRDVVAIWNTIVGRMAPSLKLKTYDDSKKN